MCPAIPISEGYDIAASVYETMANAARAIEQANERHLALPFRLWSLSREARAVYLRCVTLGGDAFVRSSDGAQHWSERFRHLHSQTETLYTRCKKLGYTNRTITAGSLNSLRKCGDEFLDLAETIDLITDPRTEEHFAAARREMEAGETVDFFSLPL